MWSGYGNGAVSSSALRMVAGIVCGEWLLVVVPVVVLVVLVADGIFAPVDAVGVGAAGVVVVVVVVVVGDLLAAGTARARAPAGWRNCLTTSQIAVSRNAMIEASVLAPNSGNGWRGVACSRINSELKAVNASEKIQKVSNTMKPTNPRKRKEFSTTRQERISSAAANTMQSVQARPSIAASTTS